MHVLGRDQLDILLSLRCKNFFYEFINVVFVQWNEIIFLLTIINKEVSCGHIVSAVTKYLAFFFYKILNAFFIF